MARFERNYNLADPRQLDAAIKSAAFAEASLYGDLKVGAGEIVEAEVTEIPTENPPTDPLDEAPAEASDAGIVREHRVMELASQELEWLKNHFAETIAGMPASKATQAAINRFLTSNRPELESDVDARKKIRAEAIVDLEALKEER